MTYHVIRKFNNNLNKLFFNKIYERFYWHLMLLSFKRKFSNNLNKLFNRIYKRFHWCLMPLPPAIRFVFWWNWPDGLKFYFEAL